jgi:aminopeptidase N
VRVYEREQSFYFPLEEKPAFISFDVGNKYLKTVALEYGVAELKAQLQFDPDPVSRIYAAHALAKKGGLEAVKTLSEVLNKEPFWGVRAEVAGQLAEIKLDQAFEGLVSGLRDKDARVRRAVVGALGKIKTHETYKALRSILDKGDDSYYVEAAAASAIGGIAAANPDEKPTDEQVLKELKFVLKERQGWNEVVRSGAIAGLAQMKTSEDALNLILKYTAAGTPQALRLAAIRSLGTISTGQTNINLERILQRLAELSKETFFLTQVSVVVGLGQMETRKAIRILRSLADQTPDGRVRRMADEAVQRVQKNAGSDAAVKQLREELDQVKKENQDLKSRMESLEAKAKKD